MDKINHEENNRSQLLNKKYIYSILSGLPIGIFALASVDLFTNIFNNEDSSYAVIIGGMVFGLLFIPMFIRYRKISKALQKMDK